ncbi:enoyl-CoA hydratase/isomerase family protein [Virgibacillus sp. NKC19-16]|uniref:enoyl-CoA hydratase/isomerase family protein n=1 Tax=Virgibacillus salidurans TaxID=2831673 RepID=UPI001F47D5E0|nr:enoyl-CoA hydratase-related protein [Virgibacillus sp. NKC19-16]UJL45431.1 enoyl-CoA hydratase/isomerase family protein [Virgibacillus sp. NKC19-16]
MEFVKFELEGSIGIVTIDRPPVNSLNLQAYDEIKKTFEMINSDRTVRVVILRAEGKVFIAGNDVNDISSITSDNYLEYKQHVLDCIQAVYNCRVPVIVALSGASVGAGLALVSSCDLIIASDRAKVGVPEINIGLVGAGDGPSRLVPHKVVRYLGLTGEYISASELRHYGGVLDVVPDENLMDRVLEVARKIEKKSPMAVEHWKQYLNKIEVYNKVEDDGDLRTLAIIDKEDTKEAVNAFLEKREPKFK